MSDKSFWLIYDGERKWLLLFSGLCKSCYYVKCIIGAKEAWSKSTETEPYAMRVFTANY